MHEFGIVMSIVEIVLDELKRADRSDGKVEKVVFEAGKLHAIIKESLLFNYDVVKEEYPQLKDSTLEFKELPVVCRCGECGKEFKPGEANFICPECSSSLVELLSGKEMSITQIILNEE